MIDMTSWPELDVDVLDDVELDPNNIRLEILVDAPQPDIMRDIFVNGDAFSLVEGIIKVGYLTHETPIAIERNGRTLVVEGNRRLAALKAIQNPYLIPEFQARITALTKDFAGRDGLRTIRVKKAPDQDQANQLIAAIHTSNIRSRWKPARQAAFFQAQVDAGKTLPALLAEYPMSSVRRFVRASQILNRFKNVPYRDPSLSDFVRSAKFPTTTLARIYESAEFTRILGVEMRPSGAIRTSATEARFNRVATHIISGMKSGDLTARTLPTTGASKFIQLMDEIRQIVGASTARPDGHDSDDSSNSNDGGGSSREAGAGGDGNGEGAGSGGGTTSSTTQGQQHEGGRGGGGGTPTGSSRRHARWGS